MRALTCKSIHAWVARNSRGKGDRARVRGRKVNGKGHARGASMTLPLSAISLLQMGNKCDKINSWKSSPAPNAVHMNFSNGASGWLAPDGTVYDEISRKPVAKFTGTLQNGTYTPIRR